MALPALGWASLAAAGTALPLDAAAAELSQARLMRLPTALNEQHLASSFPRACCYAHMRQGRRLVGNSGVAAAERRPPGFSCRLPATWLGQPGWLAQRHGLRTTPPRSAACSRARRFGCAFRRAVAALAASLRYLAGAARLSWLAEAACSAGGGSCAACR